MAEIINMKEKKEELLNMWFPEEDLEKARGIIKNADLECVAAGMAGTGSRTGVDARICKKMYEEYKQAEDLLHDYLKEERKKGGMDALFTAP